VQETPSPVRPSPIYIRKDAPRVPVCRRFSNIGAEKTCVPPEFRAVITENDECSTFDSVCCGMLFPAPAELGCYGERSPKVPEKIEGLAPTRPYRKPVPSSNLLTASGGVRRTADLLCGPRPSRHPSSEGVCPDPRLVAGASGGTGNPCCFFAFLCCTGGSPRGYTGNLVPCRQFSGFLLFVRLPLPSAIESSIEAIRFAREKQTIAHTLAHVLPCTNSVYRTHYCHTRRKVCKRSFDNKSARAA